MKRKLKWMMAALLGFSTACSTVKNASQEGLNDQQPEPTPHEIERIRLMYGTPSPRSVVVEDSATQEVTPKGEQSKIQAVEVENPTENR